MDFTDRPDWGNVQSIFAQAVELPPAERESFLAQTCSTDPDLRQQVERLLSAHDSAGGFLEALDAERAAALIDDAGDTDAPPDRIGAYRIVRRLGGGGMGVVYLAHDTRLDRPVALKLLRDRYGTDDGARRRLIAEAQAASALDHPHIVPVYEIGEAPDGRMFIAMAWCEGESLVERLRRGPIPPRDAARIARQVTDALGVAHRRGIVHRDVKPANIMLTPIGARLVDFGIALVAGRELDAAGRGAGTPAYMSPEQSRGEELDHASDLWSLGVVLYEMLTGRRPFRANNRAVIAHAVGHTAPEPVRTVNPDVPAGLARLVEHCLETDPAERPPGAAAVVADLDTFLEASAPRERSIRRRSRIVGGVAAAGLTIAFIVAAFVLWTSPHANREGNSGVAVLPFRSVAADTALERLGRELSITLSTNLDGAAGMQVVHPTSLLGMIDDASELTLERAAALASGLGAQQMVYGQLIRSGSDVRLDAAVYATRDLTVLGRTAAIAPAEDITALTDSTTVGLLTSAWTGRSVSTPNLAAITTASVPALRAYLDGELAISQSRFRAAAPAFARAIAADSTFWFAYWRYLYSLAWHGQAVDSVIAAAVVEHREGFPQPDRRLVAARMSDGQTEQIDSLMAITDQYPTWWPAWFDLGDKLTHHGPFLGHSFDDARDALERVVELNPRFVPAWQHLFWIAIHRRDTTRSGEAFDRLTELRLDSLMRDEWDLQTLDYYMYLDHLARTGGEPDEQSAALGARILAGYNGPLEPERLAVSLSLYGFHRAQVDMSARVLALDPAPRVEAAQDWATAVGAAGRGDWNAALSAVRQYLRGTVPQEAGLRAWGLIVAGAWIGALPPDSALALRPVALGSRAVDTAEGAVETAWLDGLVACTQNDIDALRAARGRLTASAAAMAPTLEASLAAMESAMEGRVQEAGRALAQIEWNNADAARQFGYASIHPFLLAIDRLAAGRWLLAAGDTAQAQRLLLFHETDLPGSLQPMPVVNVILGSLALPTLARIEEARGRPDRARHLRELFRERTDRAPDDWIDGPLPGCG
jgi:serine/threonine protein kinase/tetratricopeptide (TPR) repeat protein